ncbi:hypothetical protein RKD20_009340 [Streptomyces sp. SLBN-8D4]
MAPDGKAIMKLRQTLKFVAAVAATTALMLFSTSPASAAGEWQTYKSNSNWHCGSTSATHVSNNVVFQTCIVVTPDGTKGQVVLVVSNRGTKDLALKVGMVQSDELYAGNDHVCNVTYFLAGGEARGCFGPTVAFHGCGYYWGNGSLWANALEEDSTFPVRYDNCA